MPIFNAARKLSRSHPAFPSHAHGADGLEAFNTESPPPPTTAGAAAPRAGGPPRRPNGVGVSVTPLVVLPLVVALAAGGIWAYRAYAIVPPTATLTVQSTPSGADVTIDGKPSGVTPLSLTMVPGTYHVVLAASVARQRSMDVTLNAGDSVIREVEWAELPLAAVAATTGALHVQTDPPGQTVFVDDTQRGRSPLTISDLTPGAHSVQVTGRAGTFRRPVTITAGETVSLVIAPNAPAVSAGWVRIASPLLLQLHVGGKLIGDTESDRVMLPTGVHDVQISNAALGYSVTRRVTVTAGRTAEVRVTPPEGRLSINALPWAEVWLNGERLGPTPIANLSRPIGTHEVVLRHPQLGERRTTLTVSLKDTARLGIDMRTP